MSPHQIGYQHFRFSNFVIKVINIPNYANENVEHLIEFNGDISDIGFEINNNKVTFFLRLTSKELVEFKAMTKNLDEYDKQGKLILR